MKYDDSRDLRNAAKAIERAADGLFGYEESKPFNKSDDPRLPAVRAEIAAAEAFIARVKNMIKDETE